MSDSKHLILAIAAGFLAAAKALTDYAKTITGGDAAAGAGASGGKGKGKTQLTDDGLGGGDGLGDGGDGLGDGLDDGLGGDTEKKGPTIEQVREKLLALKAKDGNSERTTAIMKKAIGDASKQPTVPNIPQEKWAAVITAVDKLLSK